MAVANERRARAQVLIASYMSQKVRPRGPCVGANTLAEWLDGSLDEPVLAAEIEHHVERCATCRLSLASVLEAATADAEWSFEEAVASTARRAWPLLVVVIVLLAGIPVLVRGLGGEELGFEQRLAVAAREHGFDILDRDERMKHFKGEEERSLRLLMPAGTLLQEEVTLSWQPAARPCRVFVRRLDGSLLHEAASAKSPYRLPIILPRGESLLWEAVPVGSNRGLAKAFLLATSAERRELRDLQRDVEGADLGPLLMAHFALRRGYLTIARRSAEEWLAAHPRDRIGLETLHQALVQLDLPGAPEIRARLEVVR